MLTRSRMRRDVKRRKERATMKTNQETYWADQLGGAVEAWDFGSDGYVDYHGLLRVEACDREAAARGAADDTDTEGDPAEAWEIPEDAAFAYVTEDDQGFTGVEYLTDAEASERRAELDARMNEETTDAEA